MCALAMIRGIGIGEDQYRAPVREQVSQGGDIAHFPFSGGKDDSDAQEAVAGFAKPGRKRSNVPVDFYEVPRDGLFDCVEKTAQGLNRITAIDQHLHAAILHLES